MSMVTARSTAPTVITPRLPPPPSVNITRRDHAPGTAALHRWHDLTDKESLAQGGMRLLRSMICLHAPVIGSLPPLRGHSGLTELAANVRLWHLADVGWFRRACLLTGRCRHPRPDSQAGSRRG